jgi:hypothetical protein
LAPVRALDFWDRGDGNLRGFGFEPFLLNRFRINRFGALKTGQALVRRNVCTFGGACTNVHHDRPLHGRPKRMWRSVRSLIRIEKKMFSLRDTAMRLRIQRPLHVQGATGHQGGGHEKNNWKK